MSYRVKLGDIATRYNELTGDKLLYSLDMIKHSGYDTEYRITLRRADNEEEELVLSLWSAEASKLADLIKEA